MLASSRVETPRPCGDRVACAALLTCLLFASCHRAPERHGLEREYPFVHYETTGVTSAVLMGPSALDAGAVGRQEAAILFAADSNPDAMQSLHALDARVFLPNTGGDGIVVVGVLDDVVRWTPSAPDMAQSEPYREFHLSRWYLRAPFIRWTRETTPDDTDPRAVEDTKLRPEDFDGKIRGDVSRFVRPR
jgi:hypothetical protein